MLDGGMVPVCTLRTTFSQTSASAPGLSTSSLSSLRSAVLRRSLWHVTQYRSTRRRGLDAGVTAPAAERAGCADVCTWRQTHRIPAAAPNPTVNTLAKGKSLVMCIRREMAPAICALQYARTARDWTRPRRFSPGHATGQVLATSSDRCDGGCDGSA